MKCSHFDRQLRFKTEIEQEKGRKEGKTSVVIKCILTLLAK